MKDKKILVLILLTLLIIIIMNVPFGNYILYPFTILGTWFHEMGHGITAMMLGSDFYKLEIYSNGSGVATHSTGNYLGSIGNGIIALGGPLGPTIAGFILIVSSKNEKWSKILLFFLGIFMLISVLIWVRSIIGVLIIGGLGALIVYFTFLKNFSNYSIISQFLGLLAYASTYQSFDYFMSQGGNIGLNSYVSDTGVMQQNLLLPYWFWGGFIILISILFLGLSVKIILNKNKL